MSDPILPKKKPEDDDPSDRPAGEKPGGVRASPTRQDETTGTIFGGLTAPGIARLYPRIAQNAYQDAFAEFAPACDDVLTAELPPGTPRSHLGVRAAAPKLSQRLVGLAEEFFNKFATGLDERVGKDSDPAATAAWRLAVIQEWTKRLWRDVEEVWTTWIHHIRRMTEGTVFGDKAWVSEDPEYEILVEHQELMRSTLGHIAEHYSIPRETIQEILSMHVVSRAPTIVISSPESATPTDPPAASSPTLTDDTQVGAKPDGLPGSTPTPTSAGMKGRRLSKRDEGIHMIVGETRFRTLTNAEILKDPSLKKRLRVECQLEPGDAAKNCLDRIRFAKEYPLSRKVEQNRSSLK